MLASSFLFASVLLSQVSASHQVVSNEIPGIVKVGTKIELVKSGLDGSDDPFGLPNDLIVDKKGGVYFTDPGLNGAQAEAVKKLLGGQLPPRLPPAVYYVPAGGRAIKVADGIERPNGITLSRDEKILFLNNT